ncbi:MAG TPA: site-specific integrase [Spirochaetia bacterium]|nr:site-specific integrase [Spirochaetia bacterium]
MSGPETEDVILSRFLSIKDHYGCHITPFVRYLQDNHLTLNLAAVRAYFKHLNTLPLAARTRCARRQAVKSRLRTTLASADFNRQARLEMTLRALDRDSETKAPGFVVAGIAEDRVVTREEFDRLVAGTSRRTALFLWFLYNTGCRAAELCGARLEGCEDLGDMVRIRITGKGNKERKVEIEKSLFQAIRAAFPSESYLFLTRGGHPYLPTYVSYEIIKAGKRILGRRISAHSMRHSFATLSIREGASIKAVSTYLGHSSTSITMDMYVHETLDKGQKIRRPFEPEPG